MIEFSKTKIILLETSHSGNIGSVARAMKTMNFSNLFVVNPRCEIDSVSYAMASNAGEILDNAVVSYNLSDILSDCNYVVGTTARQRDIPIEIINPRQFAATVDKENYEMIAILFGNEARGLTNDQLSLCSIAIHIPSNKKYSSLNIASSLQIILYELFFKLDDNISSINKVNSNLASNAKLHGFLNHMDKVLRKINFVKDDRPMLSRKVNHIFKKANLSEEEINILRGILTAVDNHSQ